MATQIMKIGRMTGKEYRFPQEIKELDREYAEWAASRGVAVAADVPVEIPVHTGGSGVGEADPEAKARHAEAVAFIASYTGKFGLILDLRANRAWGTKHFRMSDKQVAAVLASKQRDIEWAAKNPPREVTIAAPVGVGDGFYKRDGVIFKVQVAVHGSGRPYAKQLVVADGSASWEYAPGMVRVLQPEDKLTLEQAAEFGRLYGICAICAAPLTNEESIEAGIGPVCRGKI